MSQDEYPIKYNHELFLKRTIINFRFWSSQRRACCTVISLRLGPYILTESKYIITVDKITRFPKSDFSYTPKPNFGSKYPKQKDKLCFGIDLSKTKKLSAINLEWLIDAYKKTPKKEIFFGKTFTIHAGTKKLQKQIEEGLSAKEIQKTWKTDLIKFNKIREQYLIYK